MNSRQKKAIFMITGFMLVAPIFLLWSKHEAKRVEDKPLLKPESEYVLSTNHISTSKARTEEKFNMKLRDAYNRINPLHVTGKTVDTEGNPVPGVEVKIWWETASFLVGLPREHNQYRWLISDGGGEWIFDVKKPNRSYVEDARKEGYVFEKSRSTCGDLVFIRETNKTVAVEAIVCMRKKKEAVLLLKSPNNGYGDTLFRTKKGQSARGSIDILNKVENSTLREPLNEDVQVEAKFDMTNTCWVIYFKISKGEYGLQVNDQKLYEAPESGYQKEAVVRMPSTKRYQNKEVFLYLRSRLSAVYSRVELKMDASGGDEKYGGQELSIEKQSFTNPYGERSLEDAQELRRYTFARDEIILQAKKAIESGTLPKKPESLAKHMEERDKILEEAARSPRRARKE